MSNYDKWLTVNEVAEKAGITTQAVYKRLQTSWQDLSKVANGRKLVNSIVLQEFEPIQVDNQNNNEPTEKNETMNEILKTLRHQLEVKDKQINELNDRLKEANELNKHNQMLLMQSMKQIPAPTEEETVEVEYEQGKEPDEEVRLPWYKRIFR